MKNGKDANFVGCRFIKYGERKLVNDSSRELQRLPPRFGKEAYFHEGLLGVEEICPDLIPRAAL
jgi:hypothetical protein